MKVCVKRFKKVGELIDRVFDKMGRHDCDKSCEVS